MTHSPPGPVAGLRRLLRPFRSRRRWPPSVRSATTALHSAIRRAMSCSVSPASASTCPRLPCSRNACGSPRARTGTSSSPVLQRLGERRADPAGAAAVLDGDHQPVPGGEVDQLGGHGQHPARVDDGDVDAVVGGPLGGGQAHRHHRADGDQQHVRAGCAAAQHVDRPAALQRRDVRPAATPFGKRTHGRAVGDRRPPRAAPRAGSPRRAARPAAAPGTTEHDRHVPHAVVRGAVVAGDAGPVEHDRHRLAVQGDVHEQLVERPVEERRVDRRRPGAGRPWPAPRRRSARAARRCRRRRCARGSARRTAARPVGCSIAAVIATTSGRSAPIRTQLVGEGVGPGQAGLARRWRRCRGRRRRWRARRRSGRSRPAGSRSPWW